MEPQAIIAAVIVAGLTTGIVDSAVVLRPSVAPARSRPLLRAASFVLLLPICILAVGAL